MDFWKTVLVLLKRWYVAVPVGLVSLGAALAAYVSAPVEYESTGTLVLTAPAAGATVSADPADATTVNPLLAFDGSLTTVSTILSQTLLDPLVVEDLVRAGASDTYEVGDGQTGGPFLVVVATDDSAQGAQDTVAAVLQRAKDDLNARQVRLGAPQQTFIGAETVVAPTPATAKLGGKVRFAGAALALGIAATLGTAYAVESVSQARRPRGARRPADDEPVEAQPEPQPKQQPKQQPAGQPAPQPAHQPQQQPAARPVPQPTAQPPAQPARAGRGQHRPVPPRSQRPRWPADSDDETATTMLPRLSGANWNGVDERRSQD